MQEETNGGQSIPSEALESLAPHTPELALFLAERDGWVRLNPEATLMTQAVPTADQAKCDESDPARHIDFSVAPYWRMTDDEAFTPLYGIQDLAGENLCYVSLSDHLSAHLTYAVGTGNVQGLEKALRDGADPNEPGALMQAADHPREEVACSMITALLDAGACPEVAGQKEFDMALESACQQGHAQGARLLIDAGANVHQRDYNDDSLLFTVLTSRTAASPAVLSVLIDAGLDVEALNHDGLRPLHFAAALHVVRPELVEALIENGADVNAQTPRGETPLHFAGCCEDPAAALALLKAGADPNARNHKGETPLHFTSNDKVAVVLLQHGSDAEAVSEFGVVAGEHASRLGPRAAEFLRGQRELKALESQVTRVPWSPSAKDAERVTEALCGQREDGEEPRPVQQSQGRRRM